MPTDAASPVSWGRNRIPGQPDEIGLADTAERKRPSGFHRDLPHEELAFGFDGGLDEIRIPHGDTAAGDDHVAFACGSAQHHPRCIE